jgi:hypothetical protein
MTANANNRQIAKIGNFSIQIIPAAYWGTVALWLVLTLIGLRLQLDLGLAIVGGFIAMILHWFSETVHQLGHIIAARLTGYPMSGLRYGVPLGIFTASLYPDEPVLPNRIHLRRALGGPLMSLLLSIVAGLIAAVVYSAQPDGLLWWLALFFFLENLIVFTLQSFVPLGFNDGSTILRALTHGEW